MIILMLIVLACLFVFSGKPTTAKHMAYHKHNYSRIGFVVVCACALWTGIATFNMVAPTLATNFDFGLRAYADNGSQGKFDNVLDSIVNIFGLYQISDSEDESEEYVEANTSIPIEAISSEDMNGTLIDPLAANTTYDAEVNPDEVEGPPCLGSFAEESSSVPSSTTSKPAAKKSASAVNISSKKTYKYNLTEAEKVALQKVALAEANVDGVKGMALVMKVILNRLDSPKFPNDVMSIIKQKNQFSTYYNGNYNKAKICDESLQALEMVLTGWDESYGALYFEHNPNGHATWQRKNLTTLFTYKGHTFSK